MAAHKGIAGNVANKKIKGLKDHKKTHKEKTLKKRTAAAEKSKAKKTPSASVAVAVIEEVVPVQEQAADDVEIAPVMKTTREVVADSKPHQEEARSRNVVVDEPVTVAARMDSVHSQDETTTDVETSKMDTTSDKTTITQAHTEPSYTIITVEGDAIGSKDDVPTMVNTMNPNKVKQDVDKSQCLKTNFPAIYYTIQVSMLNPTAEGFVFAKIKMTRNDAECNTSSDDRGASKKPTDNVTVPEQPLDIVAHRKALEAALYEKMETPRQMLIRCKYITSIDAEYHPDEEDEFADEALRALVSKLKGCQPTIKCLDDNLFEIEPIMTGLTEEDMAASTKIAPSLSVDQLFAKVKSADQTKAGIFNSLFNLTVSRAPHSDEPSEFDEIIVNLPREGRPPRGRITMGYISSVTGAPIAKPIVSRTLESVEAEMRLAANKASSNAPAFVDPAIISYKVKSQAPATANEDLAVPTVLPVNNDTDQIKVQTRLWGLPINSPPDLSPTSSHHSRTSSPVGPTRSPTPPTHYSVSPPSRLPFRDSPCYAPPYPVSPPSLLPVWNSPYNASPHYAFPNGAAFYGPGVRMNPHIGGFHNLAAQQYAHHQRMRAVYYGNWGVFGSWGLIPGYHPLAYNR